MTPFLAVLALAAGATSVWAQSTVQLNGVLDLFAGQCPLAGAPKPTQVDGGGLATLRGAMTPRCRGAPTSMPWWRGMRPPVSQLATPGWRGFGIASDGNGCTAREP